MKKIFTTLTFCFFAFIISAQNQTPNVTTATAGTLTVTFSTSSTNTFAIAVYITNSTGSLVNTMLYRTSNGDGSAQDMSTFWSKIGSSWSTSPTKLLTTTDAVTGATTSTAYTAKALYWGKTSSISTVSDGTYTVNFEMANYSPVSRRYTSGTFVKGTNAATTSAPNATGFSNISIQWQPVNTGIDNIELSTLYSIYPNPAISSVYVNGPDIQSVDVFTLEGKRIFSSNQQKLNIAALKKGTYMLSINTGKGNVSKKLIKN